MTLLHTGCARGQRRPENGKGEASVIINRLAISSGRSQAASAKRYKGNQQSAAWGAAQKAQAAQKA